MRPKSWDEIAFSFDRGANDRVISDAYDIKRIGPHLDFSVYKATMMIPSLFAEKDFLILQILV